jgi:hypothetical protein
MRPKTVDFSLTHFSTIADCAIVKDENTPIAYKGIIS